MAITTLNLVVKAIERICNSHSQIRTFADTDPWSFATSGVTNYPAALLVMEGGQITRNVSEFDFSMYFMDKTRNGESNLTEVLSDQFLTAKDIQAELRHPDWTWIVDFGDKNKMEDFAEKFDDVVAGWKMTFKITLASPDDTCQSPMSSITRF